MPIYVVISSREPGGKPLAEQIDADCTENDPPRSLARVWFVRSPFITSDQVKDSLNIKVGGNSGIVVAASRCTGIADRALVEKLQVWEDME